jgi:hypothetical protein
VVAAEDPRAMQAKLELMQKQLAVKVQIATNNLTK